MEQFIPRSKLYRGFILALLTACSALTAWQFWQMTSPRHIRAQTSSSAYADPDTCIRCHRDVADTYTKTGMARSFRRMEHAPRVEDFSTGHAFYNMASDRSYVSERKDGAYFEERSQTDLEGHRTNIESMSMDYIIGSGDHARTYLHRSSEGKLLELPVSWYIERGGVWAMSPGYDAKDQQDFRRSINFECISCHNAYPRVGEADLHSPDKNLFGTGLPEGIDCQRCHGPGEKHVRLADQVNARPEAIRAAIVNPARLSRALQMDACMQCHLETTSLPLPHSLKRVERDSFSYMPGQPLQDFESFFDHRSGTNFDQRLEVVNQAYRLAKSQCFLKSQMTCLTCHDPHVQLKGPEATSHFVTVCAGCHRGVHAEGLPSENGRVRRPVREENCLTCHMWRRRTDDAVHVVLTDHYIQRFKPKGDLLAPLRETTPDYRSEVMPFYPSSLRGLPPDELYTALAQTEDGTNLDAGIPRLRAEIERRKPKDAIFYFAMAAAYAKAGKTEEALPFFEEALRRQPSDQKTLRAFAVALATKGDLNRAAKVGEQAIAVEHPDTTALTDLGDVYLRQGRLDQAQIVLLRALAIDPDLSRASVFLGMTYARRGDMLRAEAAYREALRSQPESLEANNNLAGLLSSRGENDHAVFYMQKAAAAAPSDAQVQGNYALMLIAAGQKQKAVVALRRTIILEPDAPAPRFTLAELLLDLNDPTGAEQQLRFVLTRDPIQPQANLRLAHLLARQGRVIEARVCYELAAHGNDPGAKRAAEDALRNGDAP